MGFIEQAASDVADASKAVISLWFYLPQAAIDAAVAQYEAITVTSGSLEDGNLPGIIPLLTFGVPSAITGAVPETTSRCVIGVACGHKSGRDVSEELPIPPPRLYIHLQYDSGSIDFPSSVNASEFFQIGGDPILFNGPLDGTGEDYGSSIEVAADEWHHFIVSFDLSGGCETSILVDSPRLSFDSPCQLWLAFDDVNYNGDYLWPSNPSRHPEYTGVGANDIYSAGCIGISADAETHTFAAGNLPINGNPMGIPASTADASFVYNIKMCEIQVFTGVTLDTSIEDNRRAFITSGGRPAAASLAADLLGQEQDVYFRSYTDWQTGNNRGTAGDFDPTGTITPTEGP